MVISLQYKQQNRQGNLSLDLTRHLEQLDKSYN